MSRRGIKLGLLGILFICLVLFGSTAGLRSGSLAFYQVANEPAEPLQISQPSAELSGYMAAAADHSLQLYFKEETGAVAVRDIISGNVWYSSMGDNPLLAGKKYSSARDEVSVTVEKGGTSFTVGSYENSVKNSAVKYEKIENGMRAEYLLSHPSLPENMYLTATYYLKNNSFYATVDCSALSNAGDIRVKEIELLKGFGASAGGDSSFLVPDGCGAVMQLGEGYADGLDFAYEVYGGDESNISLTADVKDNPSVVFPVYGLNVGSHSMLALILDGDAVSTVHAQRAQDESGVHVIYPSFEITPSFRAALDEESGREAIAYSNGLYRGGITICYRFFSGEANDYSDVAVACRELFVQNGVISAADRTANDSIPFILSINGEAGATKNFFGGTVVQKKVLTNFKQAKYIAEKIVAKGVSNLSLEYLGAVNGGTYQNITEGAKLDSRLGSAKSYRELTDFITTNRGRTYLNLNLATVYDVSNTGLTGKLALSYNGRPSMVTRGSINQAGIWLTGYLRNTDSIDRSIDLLYSADLGGNVGISINDLGECLYSDSGAFAKTRQDMRNEFSSYCETLSNSKSIMVHTGNAYSLKRAALVVDQPLTASKEAAGYQSIPFVQMVLHGSLDYAGAPINAQEDYTTQMLRSVEYGALPYFVMNERDKAAAVKTYYYGDWLNIASEYYEKANAVLEPVAQKRMLKNEQLADGVFRTTYENGYAVYVNYNGSEQQVEGVTIPARDFVLEK